jgi:hypothetical protein
MIAQNSKGRQKSVRSSGIGAGKSERKPKLLQNEGRRTTRVIDECVDVFYEQVVRTMRDAEGGGADRGPKTSVLAFWKGEFSQTA